MNKPGGPGAGAGSGPEPTDGFILVRKTRSKSHTLEPTIKISRTGRITFNEAAFESLGKPDRVQFYFNPDTDQIAIVSTVESTEHSYKVRHPAPSRWTVTAKNLVRELKLNPKFAKGVDATVEQGRLVAKLADIRNAHEADKVPN
jgi:hypothetical protein